MGDMTADPCWWSFDVVNPTLKPPSVVEPSERSRSRAASEMDTVQRSTNGVAWIKSPTSSVCFSRFTARLASERSLTTARDTEPRRVDAVPASSGRHWRATQDRETLLPLAAPSPRPRCREIGRSSPINLVMSTLKLRSSNCVKWRPATTIATFQTWSSAVVSPCFHDVPYWGHPSCGPPPRATHNQQTLQVRSCLHRPLVFFADSILIKERGIHMCIPLVTIFFNFETIRDRHPDLPLTSRHTSRSSRTSAPSGTPGNPSEGGVAYSGSFLTHISPCMNALSPLAEIPSDVVDVKICSVMLMDDNSGVGQLRSVPWMSGSSKPRTHHLALAL